MDSSGFTILLIILAALIVDYLLNIAADILNLGRLRNELPEHFEHLYDAEKYRQSQDYLRTNTRFGWVTSTFNLILVLCMWFGKGFTLLDQWVRSWHQGAIVSGLLYIGILAALKFMLSLPFSAYATFVIEERFGFNRTTVSTFVMDTFKGLVLSIIIGGALLASVLAFFEYTSVNAWWYCWITVTLFTLIMQYIFPTWIMPIFNRFKPLEDGELKHAIMSYARSIDFPLENVFVMDGSKRSSKSNAFFTGFGRHKRIVLFDTLIARHSVAELLSILAHEMGHYKKKHIHKMMITGILHTGVLLFLLSVFIRWQPLFNAFFMKQPSVYAGLIFFGLLYSPLEFMIGIFMQRLSRKNEYEADRFAVTSTQDSVSLANALKKLSVHNLSNLYPHPLYVMLHYSHPPILKRLEAINRIAA